jgi:hypothetical protein
VSVSEGVLLSVNDEESDTELVESMTTLPSREPIRKQLDGDFFNRGTGLSNQRKINDIPSEAADRRLINDIDSPEVVEGNVQAVYGGVQILLAWQFLTIILGFELISLIVLIPKKREKDEESSN